MHSLRFMRCRPRVRRPAASGRRGPLRLHSKAPHRSPSLRLSSRYALRSMPPIGRHHCALRSRRRAPANGSGDVAVSPDARLQPRVGAATPERSSGSRSRSPRLSRGCDTLRLASGMPGSTLSVQSHLGFTAEGRRSRVNDRLRDRSTGANKLARGPTLANLFAPARQISPLFGRGVDGGLRLRCLDRIAFGNDGRKLGFRPCCCGG